LSFLLPYNFINEQRTEKRLANFEDLSFDATYRLTELASGPENYSGQYSTPFAPSKATAAPVHLIPLKSATVVSNYNLVISDEKFVIAEMFGTKESFQRNMSWYGNYFGYRTSENMFDIRQFGLDADVLRSVPLIHTKPNRVLAFSIDKNDRCLTHWIWRCLYHLFLLQNSPFSDYFNVFLFSYVPHSWQSDILSFFFPKYRNMQIAVYETTVRVEELSILTAPEDAPYYRPFVEFLKSAVAGRKHDKQLPTRVFITRDDASTRKISNREEFYRLVRFYGFEILTMTRLTFEEQLLVCANAKILIFIDGSHQVQASFAARADLIVMLSNSAFAPDSEHMRHFFHFAQIFGIQKDVIVDFPCTPATEVVTTNSDLVVDVLSFEKMLVSKIAKS